jgi:outer membrane protein OmpA-like peptidoglycan-associated protein
MLRMAFTEEGGNNPALEGSDMRATAILVMAGMVALSGGAAGADELVSKETILKELLGPPRAISSKQRTSVNLPTVTFELNSAELTPQGQKQLEILGEALREGALEQRSLTIAGHTDATGSAQYNQDLSVRRAETAKQFLVDQAGLDSSRVSSVGFGESRLLKDMSPVAAEQRRIEVEIGSAR